MPVRCRTRPSATAPCALTTSNAMPSMAAGPRSAARAHMPAGPESAGAAMTAAAAVMAVAAGEGAERLSIGPDSKETIMIRTTMLIKAALLLGLVGGVASVAEPAAAQVA